MRKNLLIFFGLFIFIMLPNNVFAESLVPGWASINGNTYVANGEILGRSDFVWLGYNGANGTNGNLYVDISIDASYENDEERTDYPYVMLYVLSQSKDLKIKRNSSCNTTCFSDSIQYGIIGHSTFQSWDLYMYAVVLPINKLYYDDNRAMYRVNDVIRFSVPDAYYLTVFTNIWFTKDADILAGSYTGTALDNLTQTMINNQNSNTQSIINNQNSNQSNTNQKLDNIDDTMKSEEAPTNSDVSGKANEWSSKNASTGPVSGMVLMPITLLNAYVSGMSSTCSAYNLGNLMGTDLILPCINVSDYLGSTLWGVIDILFSGFMIYAMGKKFVKIFNDFTNLRDNQMDELYGGGK